MSAARGCASARTSVPACPRARPTAAPALRAWATSALRRQPHHLQRLGRQGPRDRPDPSPRPVSACRTPRTPSARASAPLVSRSSRAKAGLAAAPGIGQNGDAAGLARQARQDRWLETGSAAGWTWHPLAGAGSARLGGTLRRKATIGPARMARYEFSPPGNSARVAATSCRGRAGRVEIRQISPVATACAVRLFLAGAGGGLLGQPGRRPVRPVDRRRPVGAGVPGVLDPDAAERRSGWCCRSRPLRRRSM